MAGKKGMVSHKRGKGRGYRWLLSNINYSGEECLIWPFSTVHNGYGQLGHNGRMYRAHRLMCELVHGPSPDDTLQAAHSCGNGHLGCCAPLHLSWKTHRDNHFDRILYGTKRDKKEGKLSKEDVAFVRSQKGNISQMKLAEMFRVSHSCIEHWQRHDREPIRMPKSPVSRD